MEKPLFYIGIDIAATTFTSSIGCADSHWHIIGRPETFENIFDSFAKFSGWLRDHGVKANNSVACMEATGVYSEVLAHFLVSNGYILAIEPPLKVKRAFKPAGHKSDPVDSQQIAEYAYRFWDELSRWVPREEILEQIKTLLTTREQFVTQKTGHHNALKALEYKHVHTPLAEKVQKTAIAELKTHIKEIENEIERLIGQDPDLRNLAALLISVPGVGLLLAAHLLVIIQSAPEPCTAKNLAAYIGICPYENSSGSSGWHTPTSRHYGPRTLRKLIFLAAMSNSTHNPQFKLYAMRKAQEGKPKKVVVNNIANKLLKVIVAVVRTNTEFIPGYRSVNPSLLNLALT